MRELLWTLAWDPESGSRVMFGIFCWRPVREMQSASLCAIPKAQCVCPESVTCWRMVVRQNHGFKFLHGTCFRWGRAQVSEVWCSVQWRPLRQSVRGDGGNTARRQTKEGTETKKKKQTLVPRLREVQAKPWFQAGSQTKTPSCQSLGRFSNCFSVLLAQLS